MYVSPSNPFCQRFSVTPCRYYLGGGIFSWNCRSLSFITAEWNIFTYETKRNSAMYPDVQTNWILRESSQKSIFRTNYKSKFIMLNLLGLTLVHPATMFNIGSFVILKHISKMTLFFWMYWQKDLHLYKISIFFTYLK